MSFNLLEQMVMGEISGKNAAIHAYDGIIWKVRTGFVTLVFSGWAILLKSMAGEELAREHVLKLVICMFLVSLVLSVVGWVIDWNYVRRKFRVIHSLNRLMEEIYMCDGNLKSIPVDLLTVAGDDGDKPFDSSGYKQALIAGMFVFWIPPILFAAVVLVLS